MPVNRLLKIYLQDHDAGAAAGVARAKSLAEAEASSDDGPELTRVSAEIAEDRESLQRIMKSLDVPPARMKEVAARAGERAGLLKRNGSMFERSPLTTIVELEAMLAAVEAKRAGWMALKSAAVQPLGGVDLDELTSRADGQVATLSAIHDRRAAAVLQ